MSDPSVLPQSWHEAVQSAFHQKRHASPQLSSQYTRLLQSGAPGSAVYLNYLADKKKWMLNGKGPYPSSPHPLWDALLEVDPPSSSSWKMLMSTLSLGLSHLKDGGSTSSWELWQAQLMAFHDLLDLANHPKLEHVRLEMIEHIVSDFTNTWLVDVLLKNNQNLAVFQAYDPTPPSAGNMLSSLEVLRALCADHPTGDFATEQPLFIDLLSKMSQSRRCLNLLHLSTLYHLSFISAFMHQHLNIPESMSVSIVLKAVRDGVWNSTDMKQLRTQLEHLNIVPLKSFPTDVEVVGAGMSNLLTAPDEYWERYQINLKDHQGRAPRGSYQEFEEYLDNRFGVEEDLIGLNDICLYLDPSVPLPANIGRILDIDPDYRFTYRALAAHWDKQALVNEVPNQAAPGARKKI